MLSAAISGRLSRMYAHCCGHVVVERAGREVEEDGRARLDLALDGAKTSGENVGDPSSLRAWMCTTLAPGLVGAPRLFADLGRRVGQVRALLSVGEHAGERTGDDAKVGITGHAVTCVPRSSGRRASSHRRGPFFSRSRSSSRFALTRGSVGIDFLGPFSALLASARWPFWASAVARLIHAETSFSSSRDRLAVLGDGPLEIVLLLQRVAEVRVQAWRAWDRRATARFKTRDRAIDLVIGEERRAEIAEGSRIVGRDARCRFVGANGVRRRARA